jgi:integrase
VEGRPVEGPIRAKLVERVCALAVLLRRKSAPLQITEQSFDAARALQARYAKPFKGARPVLDDDIEQLVRSLDDSNPRHLRLKSGVLLLRSTWARPSEILSRRYPSDINANYRRGIVIAVPTSKTSISPQYFNVEHDPNPTLCGVCTLRKWLDWLGPGYRGPLFPTLGPKQCINAKSLGRSYFSAQLSRAFAACGITTHRFTAYSLRKGQATLAAAHGLSLRDIQGRLRHGTILQSVCYIDAPILFQLVRATIE